MNLICDIARNVRVVAENKAEEHAIKNIFYAKVANLLGLKNVTFNSVLNKSSEMPVAHYCLNFVPSGGNKNTTVAILDNVFNFSKNYINSINEQVRQEYVDFKTSTISPKVKNKHALVREIEQDAKCQEQLVNYITDATPESLYQNAELIDNLKKGYISIKNTEFLNYFLTSINDKTSNNAKFLNILYNAWDGQFDSRKILGKMRQEVSGITTTAILLSDASKLANSNLNVNFKQKLLDGYARRFFFYYEPNKSYLLDDIEEPEIEDVEEANAKLLQLSKELQERFKAIKDNTCYVANNDLIKTLNSWFKNVAIPTNKALYINKNRELNVNDSILEVSLYNCRWLILKLAVIIHAITEPTNKFISTQALFDAINFYWESYTSLKSILYKKGMTIIDEFVDYFVKNINKDVTKTQLREVGILTNKNTFKDEFENLYPEVVTELNKLGYNLKTYSGSRRAQFIRCTKLDDIIPHPMCVSVAKLKNMDDTPTKFEYVETSVNDFIEMIKGKYAFVACELKNGERKNANFINGSNLIFLDFDNVESFEATKALFDEFSYITYTSKNHQKDKNGKVCDRFRLILFTETFMPSDREQYGRVMNNIISMYDSDPACKDPSRLFWSNPSAIVTKNSGSLFDWRKFDFNAEQEYKAVKPLIVKSSKSGKTISDVLMTEEGSRRLGVDRIVRGQRNVELLRVSLFLMHLVQDGEIEHDLAIAKIHDIINNMDSIGFKEQEKRRMINIVTELRL